MNKAVDPPDAASILSVFDDNDNNDAALSFDSDVEGMLSTHYGMEM